MYHLLVPFLKDLNVLGKVRTKGLIHKIQEVYDLAIGTYRFSKQIGHAMSGHIVLKLGEEAIVQVAASDLNAATSGDLFKAFSVQLVDKYNEVHTWAESDLVLTPTKSTTNSIGLLTLAPVAFNKGKAYNEAIFSTDGGITPHVVGDWHKVLIQVAADDKILGYTVASTLLTFDVV